MAQPQKPTDLPWPLGGLSEHLGYSDQERTNSYTRQLPTTVSCQNVRNYDPTTGRARGAQRAGHTKYLAAPVNGSNFVQHVNHIELPASISGTSVRTLKGLAVAGGNVVSFTSAGFGATTGGMAALDSSFPYLDSAFSFQKLYFVDGANWKVWDAASDTVSAWSESTGNALPTDSGNLPRLICNWRNRCILSGIKSDSQNWFMSAQGDFTNFNYGAKPITEGMAVAGNNAPAGKCADTITALIPYTDDLLVIGGGHTVWQMSGDPMAGGRLDCISDITGIAFGKAWCRDPAGLVYFWGSRGGLYAIAPGSSVPQRLSFNRIENRLAQIDLSTNVVRMAWDDRSQSVMIYVTPIAGGATTNYVFDTRNQAFWLDSFATTGHQPSAVCVLEGDTPTSRVLLLGCMDGYLRYLDVSAGSDDGTAISSFVYFGPLQLGGGGNVRLHELQAVLGASSGPVDYAVYDGASPEQAFLKSAPRFQGRWKSGRNKSDQRWASAQTIYLKLGSTALGNAWQFESLTAMLQGIGPSASRAF